MIRVIKVGGRVQSDPGLAAALAATRAGTRMVVVHGGGDEVTSVQRRLGVEPRFHEGRRVTSAEDLEVVRMVLSGTVNKRLVRQLLSAGVPAVGLSGEDGALLVAHPLDGGALGAVGSPSDVTPGVLLALLDHGFVPVVSPLGRHVSSGDGLNVNGDDAAAAIAVALHADDLLLVADVDGVRDAEGQRVDVLDLDAAARLVRAGVAHGGMSAKLDAARRAVMGGVRCVRIGALDAIRDLSSGTLLTLTPSVV